MDGSRHLGVEHAPDIITHSKGIDTLAKFEGWSTAPLPLPKPNGFVIGARNGRIYFFDRNDSLSHVIELSDKSIPDQILTSGQSIYAISITGTVNAFSLDGKLRWSAAGSGPMTGQALLAGSSLVIPTGHSIQALDTLKGTNLWGYTSQLTVTASSYSQIAGLIACALSGGASSGGDSLLILTTSGSKKAEVSAANLEITSNLAFADENGTTIVFGALGGEHDGRRDALVVSCKDFASGKFTINWKHKVPFIAGNIAINKAAAFASGFRSMEGEVTSGVAAFKLADTTTMWQRSFAEPLVAPIAASDANVYFVSSFESNAVISSRGLLVTLTAGEGKTVSEKIAPGAAEGLSPFMPMPDEDGRILVADAARPVVYVFDRSGLKRMF